MRRLNSAWAILFLFAFFLNDSIGQVTSEFTANVTEGCGSLQVSFTDQSSSTAGSITSWSWDLSGVTSGNQNPGRIYGTPGSYTICLTATDSEGNSDTECKTDYITVFELPSPDFTALPEAGCTPLTVEFIDLSTSNDGAIEEWIWGLGGTSGVIVDNGTAPSISSTYNIPDSYTISLTVTDENGCINTITKNDYVTVSPDPVVAFSAPVTFSCANPFIVDFSNDSDTQDMSFFWDFGNNTFFNGTNPPQVIYNNWGSYSPVLIGTNTISGCSDTLVLTDYIQVGYPIDFSYSAESGCRDLTVTFTDNSIDPATSVFWEFGDGGTSFDANPTYTYTTPGCYTVTLTREVNGCLASATSQNCIEVFDLPTVTYSNDGPIGCTAPHNVQFAGSSATAVDWFWDFGNGNFSTDQNPEFSYFDLGTYTVTLTVTDANGCTASINTDQILVQEIIASVPLDTMTGCSPLDVALTHNSTSPTTIVNWEWEVTNNSATPPAIFTSNSENPNFTLIDTGFYEIRLIVTNDIGCIDTSTFYEQIAVGIPPVMGFSATPTVSCVESPITFQDGTSDNTNAWFWEFGDGSFGLGPNPEHEYVDTGYFDVTLHAFHHGCQNTLSIDSFVYIQPPIAGFNVNTFCDMPYYIELVDNSIGADSIFWDFGIAGVETDTTSIREPTFTYPQTGDYIITMTVFNFDSGCSDDQTFFIQIREIQADFSIATPTTGCVPLTITFDNQSQDANAYNWSASGGVFTDPGVEQPFLTFSNPNIYTDFQLIVTDVNGCQDTLLNQQDTVYANQATADFVYDPIAGCRPLNVNFTENASSVFGNVTEWYWDFEGGAPFTNVQNPNVSFENIGLYNVTLTVVDDWGCQDELVVPDAVQVTYPLVNFYTDTVSCTELAVSFINTSVGHTLAYQWDFGDGNLSTDVNPTHLYQNEGIYTVCLTATDVNGCDSTFCRNDYVVIADPVASFTADSTNATCPPLIVNFDNQSINSTEFIWDFGDGSGNSNQESPPHVYTEPGTFDVTVVASFNGACHDTLLIPDYINVEGPVGSFTFDIDSACVPAVITFYGESIDLYNFIWDFGNGDLDSTLNVMNDTIQYNYTETGRYVPKLFLQDAGGCTRAFESSDTIQLEELAIDFIALDSILCTGEDNTTFINLTNSSLPINSFEWIFAGGNPGTSTVLEPTVQYDNSGYFDVTLISSNGFCTDTLTKPDYMKIGETPVADFIMDGDEGCPPFSVSFTDNSTVSTGFIAGWEWDYGDGTTADVQNPTHVFNETGSYDISLVVTTDVGCTDEAFNSVSVQEAPEVNIPEPYNICIGNVVELEVEITSDTTGITYYWIPDPTLSCTNCLRPSANPTDTTTYYFVVNNAIGCSDTSEVVVDVRPFPAPIVNITNDTTICANSVIQIVADGGANVYEYQWDNSALGLSCYDNCFNPIASPEVSTIYTVTVTNEYNCETIEDVQVDVLDEYQPFAGPDKTICEGNSTQLDITFGNDPVWMVTEGLSCAYCPDPVANPEVTTTYLVEVTTDAGCEIIDTLVINVMLEDDVDAGTDQVICLGEQIELDAIGEGTISWAPASSLSNTSIINPIASPTENIVYFLTVTNDECTISDSVAIDVATSAEVFAEGETICVGESVQLFADGTAEEFSWTPSHSLDSSSIADPLATPDTTTTYVVTGSLGSCLDDTAHVTVTVIPGPITHLTQVYDFFPGQTVEVEVTTEDVLGYTYEWDPIELVSCVSCNNPQITPDSTVQMMVTVTDPITGCWTVDTTLLRRQQNCPPDLIGVPNIFTPNNDGMNDVLELHLSPAVQPTGIEMLRIFDRWGAQVFESTNANEGWDGTYKGKPLPNGVYVYFIEAQCPVSEGKIMKKGDITLIR